MNKKVPFTLRITDKDLKDSLAKTADKMGFSQNDVINMAIKDYVKKAKKEDKQK